MTHLHLTAALTLSIIGVVKRKSCRKSVNLIGSVIVFYSLRGNDHQSSGLKTGYNS